jgi:hypothetical protein
MFDKPPNAGDQAVRQLHAGDAQTQAVKRIAEAQAKAATGGKNEKAAVRDFQNSHRFQK